MAKWDNPDVSSWINRKPAKPEENENLLFVTQNRTDWVIWDIIHLVDKNVNNRNEQFFDTTRDNKHIMWQAVHFWTFGAVQSYLNERVKDGEMLDESVEIIFL